MVCTFIIYAIHKIIIIHLVKGTHTFILYNTLYVYMIRFHTGDIVEMVSDKNFKIIDRIKNFFKLSQVNVVCIPCSGLNELTRSCCMYT